MKGARGLSLLATFRRMMAAPGWGQCRSRAPGTSWSGSAEPAPPRPRRTERSAWGLRPRSRREPGRRRARLGARCAPRDGAQLKVRWRMRERVGSNAASRRLRQRVPPAGMFRSPPGVRAHAEPSRHPSAGRRACRRRKPRRVRARRLAPRDPILGAEPGQDGLGIGDTPQPLVPVLGPQPKDQALEIARHPVDRAGGPRRRSIQVPEMLGPRPAGKGAAAGHQLVEHAAGRSQIRSGIDRLAAHLFRTHGSEGPERPLTSKISPLREGPMILGSSIQPFTRSRGQGFQSPAARAAASDASA
jgi:hypothetical protein